MALFISDSPQRVRWKKCPCYCMETGDSGGGCGCSAGRAPAACRALVVESENGAQRGQFLPDLQAHSPAMGQKDGENELAMFRRSQKWTAAPHLQPTIPKPDRLLDGKAMTLSLSDREVRQSKASWRTLSCSLCLERRAMHTFYEFFSGGGMVRSGLGDGWDCLLANDLSSMKAQVYAENWGADHLVVGDVFDLRAAELPGRADLAWGSFPCQDLSLAGLGAGLDGARSSAFWGYWDLVRALGAEGRKPRIVALENVSGALTSRGGKDFEIIAAALGSEGYLFGALVIDAVHFVPQSRPRLFIIGIDETLRLPEVLHAWTAQPAWHPTAVIRAHNRLPTGLQQRWRWWNPQEPSTPPTGLDALIEREPQGVHWHTAEETSKILQSMSDVNRRKVMAVQADGRMKVGTVYRRTREGVVRAEVRFDGVSGCLRTPSGGSSRQTLMVVEGERIRTRLLSPREAARLMGLPDTYRLPARYNHAYHVAGDGVAAPVVRHLARELFEPVLLANADARVARIAA